MNKISIDDVNCTEIRIFYLSLFQIRIPYRPIDSKLCTLATNRDNLPSGKQILALTLTHDNVQYLEKLKQLVLFTERNLEEKNVIRLNFFSQLDGPVMGNGTFKTSVFKKRINLFGPPSKDKLPKNSTQGSLLLGAISYGTLSFGQQEEGKNPLKNPVSYQLSYILPPNKLDEDKGKGSSSTGIKTVSDRLEEEVRDVKIKKKLSVSLKSEYPKYTPLLAKILEGLLSQSNVEDKIHHDEEVIDSANEVFDSIDREELAKFISLKSDPEDEEAEGQEASSLASSKDLEITRDQSQPEFGVLPDLFEENFKELKKWVNLKSSKYGTLLVLVLCERRSGRLGTALKALNDIIQDDGEPPKKKLYELKLSLLDEIGWSHLAIYERQWMHVRFPASLPLSKRTSKCKLLARPSQSGLDIETKMWSQD
ncbi:hypothetical protein CMV_020394 [Castanea mollissima]|uniref:Tripeptidyl peptidase II second Ig-like domain-containing protein n=1 Tax=Castanea mollissima TaxID=60419 RepID=A0A8J4VDP0_9ROSI|nr:hypothetical protein CMV_020394 [Castanea mollissima]